MKKLIMTAAMIAAGVAMADIVSSSVVGYSNGELREGFKAAGAQFIPVTGTQIDLTDITVTGYDKEEGTEEEVSVQTLDKDGEKVSLYLWIDIIDGDDVYYGWIDSDSGDFVEPDNVFVGAGESLWVDAPSTDFKLVLPGVTL